MISSLNIEELLEYTLMQVRIFFPDNAKYNSSHIRPYFISAIERVENCFSSIDNKYYSSDTGPIFNHLNGDQYSMYLYFLANTLYRGGYKKSFLEKLFLLNKLLHGVDIFYEVELPDIFLFVHPLGTVLGRAEYSNYLIVYQNCSIGANNNIYPSLGEFTSIHPGASILGDCKIGTNCKIAAKSLLLDKNLNSDSLYIGNPKNFSIIIKEKKHKIWK